MEKPLYFAYGSNINLDQMRYRCPDATVYGQAVLDNYDPVSYTHLAVQRTNDRSYPVGEHLVRRLHFCARALQLDALLRAESSLCLLPRHH